MESSNDQECIKISKLKNYYEILGVHQSATEDEIRKAYKKLAVKYHPDKNKSEHSTEAFKKISSAFSVLSNPEKKKNYDMFGDEDTSRMNFNSDFVDPFQMFNMFFNENMGHGGFANGSSYTIYTSSDGTRTVYTSNSGCGFMGDNAYGDPLEDLIFGHLNRRSNRGTTRERNTQNDRSDRRYRFTHNAHKDERNRHARRDERFVQSCLQLCSVMCIFFCIIVPYLLTRSLLRY